MDRKTRAAHILAWFEKQDPTADTELEYEDPFSLLVAVILSAQCTDKRINLVTPALMERFPDAASMAEATKEEIFPFIKSVSYPNNKAAHLANMARMLVKEFGGEVPSSAEELMRLPGVGRKTANVVLAAVFGEDRIAVDTHVFRVSARTGLTHRAKNPLQTEQQLMKLIPKNKLGIAHHWLILHGRYVCVARNPKCQVCGIRDYCLYFEKVFLKKDFPLKRKVAGKY